MLTLLQFAIAVLRNLIFVMVVLILLAFIAILPASAQDTPIAELSPQTFTDELTGVGYTVEVFTPANFPVGLAFAPDGRLFYNEKTTGRVRVASAAGVLQPDPVITLPTDSLQERGMLGLALSPDFETDRTLYVVHTRAATTRDWPANRLVRFQITDAGVADEATLETLLSVPIDNGELTHNGGNVHFDANGDLFISFGDYSEPRHAQDLSTPQGAIHRFAVTPDGLIPAEGNPHGPNSSIFAHGFRNPFDFTFDPLTNNLFTSEVGDRCDDELNLVLPGFNYGWGPGYQCSGTDMIAGLPLYAPPLLSFNPVEAPTGIIVYDHPAIPEWRGDLFFCNWIHGDLRRAELNADRTRIEAVHDIDLGRAACRIDLTVGPDGALYFGTVGNSSGAIVRLMQTP